MLHGRARARLVRDDLRELGERKDALIQQRLKQGQGRLRRELGRQVKHLIQYSEPR